MISPSPSNSPAVPPNAEKAVALALRLAHAEEALHAFTAGEVDAIVAPSGKTYLLHGAQEHLRRREMELRGCVSSTPDLITVINRAGTIVSSSRAAIRMLGYAPESLVGQNVFDLVHPDDLPQLHAAFFNVIEEFRTDSTVEFRHQTRDGSHRSLEATVSKLPEGPTASVVLICRDVRRREPARQSEARHCEIVTEARRARDLVLSMLVREIDASLPAARFAIDALEQEPRIVERPGMLRALRENIETQSRLVEGLLEFAAQGRTTPWPAEPTTDSRQA
jgi:PAS domain S-box-containing protein